MITTDSVLNIAAALSLAQSEMANPVKDRTAFVKSSKGDYSYRYADLASVLEAVRPALSKNGIAVLQTPVVGTPVAMVAPDGTPYRSAQLVMVTRLLHSSGEWIEAQLCYDIDPDDRIQTLGSAITYLRRYALQAIVGVVAEEDDDGNPGSGAPRTNSQVDEPLRRPEPPATRAPAPPPAAKAPKPAASTQPSPPLKADAESAEVFRKLGKLISVPVATKIWSRWGAQNQGTERQDALRRSLAAVEAINAKLGGPAAERLINDITIDRANPDDVDGIVADLVEASGLKQAAPPAHADSKPTH